MMANQLLFGRVTTATIHTSNGYLKFKNSDLEIQFEVEFDDDSKPNINKLIVYNLTQNTIHRIKKGYNLSLSAGYKGDVGVICEGKITRVATVYTDVDKITTITFKEGTDYSNIKVDTKTADPAQKYYVKNRKTGKKEVRERKQTMQITFAKNTTAETIIKRLAKILGIKIAKFELPRNKVYKKGFKVTGKIEDKLVSVVEDCGASMYWRKGKMIIRSITKGDDERFVLSTNTGLIGSPTSFDKDGEKGYYVKCLLQHRITTASIITIKSKSANGKFRVKEGTHTCNGNEFITEMKVII